MEKKLRTYAYGAKYRYLIETDNLAIPHTVAESRQLEHVPVNRSDRQACERDKTF